MSDRKSRGEFPVESFLDYRVKDVSFIEPDIARFKYAQDPPVPDLVRVLMEGNGDVDSLIADPAHRLAVQYNFETSIQNLRVKFDSFGDWTMQAGFHTWNQLLEFNVEHIYRPDFIYTNGQSVITRIDREHGLELVKHRYYATNVMGDGKYFVDDYSFEPGGVFETDSEETAEDVVRSNLDRLESLQLFATDGTTELPVSFIPMGYGFAGQIVKIGDLTHLMRQGSDFLVTQIVELPERLDGFYPKCCGTCINLRMSGMSMDMSRGSKGYCEWRMRSREDDTFTLDDLVHVMEVCDSYSPRERFEPPSSWPAPPRG